MKNNLKLDKIIEIGKEIAADFSVPKESDESRLLLEILEMLNSGNEDAKVYLHGDKIDYSSAPKYLFEMATHPRAWNDLIPGHIKPKEWYDKLLCFSRAIEDWRKEDPRCAVHKKK